ncbi:hypothetical protein [Moorella sulfitireducens (nom. illeg.)]|uniref:hypothetical protein n=1 Tax=Neomoorella sulfitireducens TaxID=2972948 RepID=UPI0021AC4259|nr:hypothetical protein [Moorella sulfitireducens]
MKKIEELKFSSEIITKAKELGATLAGIANIEDLKSAPSYVVAPLMPPYSGVGANKERIDDRKPGEVIWPEGAKSVIVVAYAHPEEKPELDYWYGSNDPIGNRQLIRIIKGLCEWLMNSHNVGVFHLPYHVERGGIYLKDAAVIAGLGCIGKCNLLVNPEYGPRLRLRGMTIDIELPSTGPLMYDPCRFCDERCNKVCPQKAFDKKVYSATEYGRNELPGRDGNYNRNLCNVQMKIDEETAEVQKIELFDEPVRVVKYCRRCELACPVGKGKVID